MGKKCLQNQARAFGGLQDGNRQRQPSPPTNGVGAFFTLNVAGFNAAVSTVCLVPVATCSINITRTLTRLILWTDPDHQTIKNTARTPAKEETIPNEPEKSHEGNADEPDSTKVSVLCY